jgi:hypothetical protein
MKNVKNWEKQSREWRQTPSATRANKEWFNKECAKVSERKNAARERTIQIKTRGAKNAY